MKNIVIALFIVALGTSACAKDESQEKVLPPVVVTASAPEPVPQKTKKVCVDQKDASTGKIVQVCRTIRIHKKLEGTRVEDAKKESKK